MALSYKFEIIYGNNFLAGEFVGDGYFYSDFESCKNEAIFMLLEWERPDDFWYVKIATYVDGRYDHMDLYFLSNIDKLNPKIPEVDEVFYELWWRDWDDEIMVESEGSKEDFFSSRVAAIEHVNRVHVPPRFGHPSVRYRLYKVMQLIMEKKRCYEAYCEIDH